MWSYIVIGGVLYLFRYMDDRIQEVRDEFTYSAELVIEPNFKELMAHPYVCEYYKRAEPIVEELVKNNLDLQGQLKGGLWSISDRQSIRFIINANYIWNDFFKRFMSQLGLSGKMLNYNISKHDDEPDLDFEVKGGLLKVYFTADWPSRKWVQTHIVSFPLFAFYQLPYRYLNFFGAKKDGLDNLKLYRRMRQLAGRKWFFPIEGMKKAVHMSHEILNQYGFVTIPHDPSDGDVIRDSEGDSKWFDPSFGFWELRHKYLTIRFKEFSSSE